MSRLIAILAALFLVACNIPTQSDSAASSLTDTTAPATVDTLTTPIPVQEAVNTTPSPVSITKAWINKGDYYPTASVRLTNGSQKTIDGIKVGLRCFNNFDEPVMSGYTNETIGIVQEKLKPAGKNTYTWPLTTQPTTTKVDAYIKEIHYTDGTTWKATVPSK
ncbi:MAG TPA: hypothetical protein VD794_08660 [Flavisolibacter sp.]|nr:hypothetical protein [Flavisolibacter sp.]